jgi:glycerol-3-phosphate acyltransferase PlsY
MGQASGATLPRLEGRDIVLALWNTSGRRDMRAAVIIAVAYLLGSLSPAYLFGKALLGVDLRDVGSRNLGARNAGREIGRSVGVVVWFLDMAKGALAVLAARAAGGNTALAVAAGAAAVAGHNWPLYHGLRGGRGASTAMGATFVLLPLPMAVGLAAWVLVALVSRSFYLGGLIAYAATVASAFAAGARGLLAWSPLLVAGPLAARHVPAFVQLVRSKTFRLP